MKATTTAASMTLLMFLAVAAVLAGVAVWCYGSRARAPVRPPGTPGPGPAPVSASMASRPAPAPEEDGAPATYVGAATCRKCHLLQHQSWARTRMASSFDALKPCDMETYEGKHLAEKRRGAGMDPTMDYRNDPKCLKCHTTGYGRPGGYPESVTPESATKETLRRAERLRGVQCEACHGPGSRYVPFFERLQSERGQYRRSEVLALGLILPDRGVCLGCHNAESPFVSKEEFDFGKMAETGTHEHSVARRRLVEETAGEGER